MIKDPYKAKYQFLINNRESAGLKHLNDSKAVVKYSNDMNIIYESIEEYNPYKTSKILIVFDDMIADLSNKKINPIVTELFIRGRKLLFSLRNLILLCQKNIRQNCTHYVKIPNKQELQQIALNHWSDIDFRDFSPFGKAFEKQIQIIEEQVKKYTWKTWQVLKSNAQKLAIEDVILENKLSEEAKLDKN